MPKHLKTLSVIFLFIFLSACGGGGNNTAGSNTAGSSASTNSSGGPANGTAATGSDPTATGGTSNIPPNAVTPDRITTSPATTGTGNTAQGADPAIATRWSIKEIPPSSSSLGTFYQDVNDAGDAISTYTIAINSNALITSGVGVAYADGRVANLGTLQWNSAEGVAINNAGQLAITGRKSIVSASGPAYKMARAGLYTNGSITEVPAPTIAGIDPATIDVNAMELNNSGKVVGYSQYTDTAGTTLYRAFVFANGVRTDIAPVEGALSTRAYAISDTDIITGELHFADNTAKAFVYRAGVTTTLGTLPGYTSSTGLAVNDSGHIAGYVFNLSGPYRGNMRPFIYADGVMKEIPLPVAGSWGKAAGINSAGQVVGIFSANPDLIPSNRNSAFLYSGGRTIDLNQLPEVIAAGIHITGAEAINNNGQILVSDASTSVLRAYLLSPVK